VFIGDLKPNDLGHLIESVRSGIDEFRLYVSDLGQCYRQKLNLQLAAREREGVITAIGNCA